MSVPNPRIKLTYRDYANTPDDIPSATDAQQS